MIVVNLKKYVSGRQAAKIIEICNRVANDTGIRIVAATQPEDLQTGCWTQHLYLPEVPQGNHPKGYKQAGQLGGTLPRERDKRILG